MHITVKYTLTNICIRIGGERIVYVKTSCLYLFPTDRFSRILFRTISSNAFGVRRTIHQLEVLLVFFSFIAEELTI